MQLDGALGQMPCMQQACPLLSFHQRDGVLSPSIVAASLPGHTSCLQWRT